MRLRSTAAASVLFGAVLSIGFTGTANAADLYNCDDYTYQEEAQTVFNQDPSDPNQLDDEDDDYLACEALPSNGSGVVPVAPTAPVGAPVTAGTTEQVSTRPQGAVAAGDGSASEQGSSLPYVLGGLAFAGAGGAALVARRSRTTA